MQLNFQRHGSGFPLIILHGLFGSLDNWQTISRRLGEGWQVFAVDLRNHGRSPHSEEFNYPAMVEDVREFMETHQLARAHLLGHSLGGKVAMHCALEHPALVEKLIVVDISPKRYPPGHLPLFEAMLGLKLDTFNERREIEAALAPAVPDLPTRQFLLKNIGRDEHGGFHWKLNLPAIHRNYGQLNEEITGDRTFEGPVLFIKGGRSDYMTEGDVPAIHRLFPRMNLKTIAKAGHWVHANAPEEFEKIVRAFLER